MERDPFEVSLEEKMDLLIRTDEAMAAVAGVTTHEATLEFVREHRLFANSEDRWSTRSSSSPGAVWTRPPPATTTSRRAAFQQLWAPPALRGYEAIAAMDLAGNASRIATEAVALLSAPPCPTGRMTLILDGTQAALQVHESCGTPPSWIASAGTRRPMPGPPSSPPTCSDASATGASR